MSDNQSHYDSLSGHHEYLWTICRDMLHIPPSGLVIQVIYKLCWVFPCSPPPSSPQTGPSALELGHLWDQTGRCNRRSSWQAPPDHPRCSTETLLCKTCWTGERERSERTCPSSPDPCSYLREGDIQCQLGFTVFMNLFLLKPVLTAPKTETEVQEPNVEILSLWMWRRQHHMLFEYY